MPYFFMSRLANTLLLSISAAFLSGPKQAMPACLSASTAPSARGSSGATTTKSMPFSLAKATMASMSFAPMGTRVASDAMPPLPGSA